MHEFSENKMKEFSQANQISKKSKDKSSSGNECLNQNKKVSFDFSNFNYRWEDKDNSIKILKRSHLKNYDFLNTDESYFQDNLFFCCSKSRNEEVTIFYENAHNYLAEFLDIQTLFNYYREFEMLKKILLDHYQKTLFETLSQIKSLHKIFSIIKKVQDILQNYNQTEVHKLFKNIERIRGGKKEYDSKILNSFKFF